jgi:hypothetical protein
VLAAHGLLSLAAFCDRRLGDAFLVRAAGTYGSGIALSYAIAIAIDPPASAFLLDRALTTLAWVPGTVIALVAAREAGGAEDTNGAAELARLRGFGAKELSQARFLGTALRIARAVGVRGLLLALFAASRAAESSLTELRWVLGVAVVALVLGALLAGLSRLAAAVLPERGRFVLMAGVALASVAAALWPAAPSLGSVFGALAPGVLGIGT